MSSGREAWTHTRAQRRSKFSKIWNFGTRACAKLQLWNSIWNTILRMRSVSAYCKGVAEKDPLVSRCEAMPKAGPSPLEWKRRLEAFARGEYAFSTGQKPRKGSRWHKVFVPLKTVPDKASQPAQRTHLENLWSVNVAYQPKLVKLVDEGSVILSLIYACTHTGVQTKCSYCTAYIQKCHFVWWFHLGQFSLPTSGWPLVLQFSLLTYGWPLVLQFSLPNSGWPLVLQFSLPTSGWPLVLQFSLPTSGWPLVLQFSLPTSGWPLVLQFSLPTSGWPLVLQFSLLPRCSHPPHSSSCKTLLLWTSHSSCGRPNFFGAYFVSCQNASSSGRSLLVQFSGGTYCDKSVQSIHTCHHYWLSASGLLCTQSEYA